MSPISLFRKQQDAPRKQDKSESRLISVTVSRGKAGRRVILRPHLTEKATRLAERGSYVFAVDRRATKPSVRRAVEESYKVKVLAVQIAKRALLKKRRGGRIIGRRPFLKKAIVTLEKGQKIELTS